VDLELQGRLAIVTGGSRGIGKAIATELAKEGAKVAVVARDLATAEATASEIAAKTGQSLYAYRADTGKDDNVRAAVSQITAEHERIDILVNCAAQPAGQKPAPKLGVCRRITGGITDDIFWADINVKVLGGSTESNRAGRDHFRRCCSGSRSARGIRADGDSRALSLLPEAGSRPRQPASDHYRLSEDLPSRWGDCCWPKPC
jgi:NAD(P)-dependent dehydrogenase (short-subunit alcohol dehydrogenase family)